MARKQKAEQAESTHNVHPQLSPLVTPIGVLSLDPDNARGHGEANLDAIAHSLKEFGQRKCIVVKRAGMVVIAGNGTLIAAKRLGWTHIAALVVDDDAIAAKAYALADNRTGELATWDYEQLIRQFQELDSAGVDVEGLGWSQEELKMLAGASFTPDAPGELPGSEGAAGEGAKDPTIDKSALKELLALYHRHHEEGEELGDFVLRAVKALVND